MIPFTIRLAPLRNGLLLEFVFFSLATLRTREDCPTLSRAALDVHRRKMVRIAAGIRSPPLHAFALLEIEVPQDFAVDPAASYALVALTKVALHERTCNHKRPDRIHCDVGDAMGLQTAIAENLEIDHPSIIISGIVSDRPYLLGNHAMVCDRLRMTSDDMEAI